jgi:hypothetical protein
MPTAAEIQTDLLELAWRHLEAAARTTGAQEQRHLRNFFAIAESP